MFPAQFDYYRPESVEEALSVLTEHADQEVEVLSGGHSLLPTMKSGLASPDALVDIGGIDALRGIDVGEEAVTYGALTTYATIAASDDAWEHTPTLAEAAHEVGDIQVRNRGTIGGNVAHSDPASDLPAAVLASDATITAQGPDGEREIAADDLFVGMFATSLAADELLTRISVPRIGDGVGAYVKKPSPSSGYAMVGVAVVLEVEGDSISSARVAANGAFDHATRLEAVEEALSGAALEESVATDAASHATDGVDTFMFMSDLQASSEFRAQLLEVYTQRALAKAIDRASALAPSA